MNRSLKVISITGVIAFIALLLGPGVVDATTYFVATTGNDSYTATQAQNAATPWATMTRACSSVQPGDTVEVAPGNYTSNSQTITANGTSGKFINFVGNYGNWPGPTLTTSSWSALDITGSSCLEFQNFNVTSTDTNPSTCSYGISIYGKSTHISIVGCTLHDCGGGGIGTGNQGTGGCDYITLEYNTIYNNAWYSQYEESGISLWELYNSNPSDNGTHNYIVGNTCYLNSNKFSPPAQHTDGEGIIVDCGYSHSSAQGGVNSADATTMVSYNTCFGNGGSGISCYLNDHVVFDQNTCYENAQDPKFTGGGELFVNSATNCTLEKNVAYSDGATVDACDSIVNDGGTTTISYNDFWGGAADLAGTGNVLGNPLFENATSSPPNFSVKSTGPANPPSGLMGSWGTY